VRLMAGNIVLGFFAVLFFMNGEMQFASKWQHVISFAVLMAILMFRPSGILGDNIQEKV
jgi:branched-chain amino acid transport system permease protein